MREFTKNRAALLSLFLTNPDQVFYMQEIGRLLGKKPGNFQRTINKMVEEGILISEYKANARYFKANKNYPLYKELKSIVFKTVGVIGTLKDVFTKAGNIDFSFIYGSYAKGEENLMSDIDLLVIGDISSKELSSLLSKPKRESGREINYAVFRLPEFKKRIKQKDHFLTTVLKEKKIFIIGSDHEFKTVIKSR